MIIAILIGAILLFFLFGKKDEGESVLDLPSGFTPDVEVVSTSVENADYAFIVTRPQGTPTTDYNINTDVKAELKPDVSVLDMPSGFIPDLKPVEKPAVTKPVISTKETPVSKPVFVEEEPVSVSSTAVKSTGLKKLLPAI